MADDKIESRIVVTENELPNEIDKINNGLKELEGNTKQVNETNKSTGNSFKEFGLKAVAGIAAAVFAVKEFAQFALNAAQKAAEYSREMKGLTEVSRAFGQNGGAAQKVAEELVTMSKGMVSASQAAQGLKFLIGSGFSLDKASEMSKAMLNIGAFNNVTGDLGQAFVDASKGIKTGSIELIENIGLTEKLSSVMKRAGVDTTTGIDITNNATQAQALYNSVMKQGTMFQGNLDEATKGYTATMSTFSNLIDKAVRLLGEKFQPIISGITSVMNVFLGSVVNEVPKASEKLLPLVTRMGELEAKAKLTKEEQNELNKLMNEISIIAPNAVSSYDSQGQATVNLARATKELVAIKAQELSANKASMELDKIRADKELEKIKKENDEKRKRMNEEIGMLKSRGATESDIAKVRAAAENRYREEFAKEVALQEKSALYTAQIAQAQKSLNDLKGIKTIDDYKKTITTPIVTSSGVVTTKTVKDTAEREKEELARLEEEAKTNEEAAFRLIDYKADKAQEEQKKIDEAEKDLLKQNEEARKAQEEEKRRLAFEEVQIIEMPEMLGEADIEADQLKDRKLTWEEEKQLDLERLHAKEMNANQEIMIEQSKQALLQSLTNSAQRLMHASIQGEKLSDEQMAEVMKQGLRDWALNEAEKAGMRALTEVGEAVVDYAAGNVTMGTAHLAAAAQNAAIAVALGAAGRSISVDQTKMPGYTAPTNNTPPPDNTPKPNNTITTVPDKQKTVYIDIKSRDVAALIAPELMALVNDGYTLLATKE